MFVTNILSKTNYYQTDIVHTFNRISRQYSMFNVTTTVSFNALDAKLCTLTQTSFKHKTMIRSDFD